MRGRGCNPSFASLILIVAFTFDYLGMKITIDSAAEAAKLILELRYNLCDRCSRHTASPNDSLCRKCSLKLARANKSPR